MMDGLHRLFKDYFPVSYDTFAVMMDSSGCVNSSYSLQEKKLLFAGRRVYFFFCTLLGSALLGKGNGYTYGLYAHLD